MRQVVLRVPEEAVEEVLDRLLPIVPGGVREIARRRHVDLRMRGPELPVTAQLRAAAGRWAIAISEGTVSDDWRERRLADYKPETIGNRLVVRPDWAPPAALGLIDVALGGGPAFGGGTHPTTRVCLELLLELAPAGRFADLGCGTGVLAIVAAKLGWGPVFAMDLTPASVAATTRNARLNAVSVSASLVDLTTSAPPPAEAIAANLPAGVHAQISTALQEHVPRLAVLSGFGPEHERAVLYGYAARGLNPVRRVLASGWVIALLALG
jgi:ribosomal protein L11 methyltransferase